MLSVECLVLSANVQRYEKIHCDMLGLCCNILSMLFLYVLIFLCFDMFGYAFVCLSIVTCD